MHEHKQNRLAREQSPYLLQHADNPVDWHPWGEEAFALARARDKPVFLSIGYSTCHWCHVMERESFTDPAVAALLNEAFVCVKVDREERPDIDNLYMTVCQMLTGGGGWPLTILMTPDKEPFFAGTYFPKHSLYGRAGMMDLVAQLDDLWKNRRGDLLASAREITGALQRLEAGVPEENIGMSTLETAYLDLVERFDGTHGGFGRAPKFPTPHLLLFLLRWWRHSGDARALAMVEQTLDAMRAGGVYDHVGFGFHRYSTDAQWLVPHFEKMLYDQALLALAYLEAAQATGRESYGEVAAEIFTYVLDDMTAAEGVFYSAEDADSEGEEGKFYLWTEEELRAVLGPEEAALAVRVFQVEEGGNFTDEVSGAANGRNILHLRRPHEEWAVELGLPAEELRARMEKIRAALHQARGRRVRPHLDDKVLTDWNGLMIAALARGARVLGQPRYAEAARRAADFILERLKTPEGRLLHRWRAGQAGIPGHLDDYAFLAWGLIELYQSTFDARYLREALALNQVILERFRDAEGGGFCFTPDDGEELLVRRREVYDGALPSGNAVAMMNLLLLARLAARPDLEEKAAAVARAFSGEVKQQPPGYVHLLSALEFAMGAGCEVIVAGDPRTRDTREMLDALGRRFLPHAVLLLRDTGPEADAPAEPLEFLQGYGAVDGRAAAYVCRDYQCHRPTTKIDEMIALLEGEEGEG